jgi:hypothetical protein
MSIAIRCRGAEGLRGGADAARVNRLHDGESKNGGCDGHNHAGENDAVTHNVLPSKERTSPWSREAASTFNGDRDDHDDRNSRDPPNVIVRALMGELMQPRRVVTYGFLRTANN